MMGVPEKIKVGTKFVVDTHDEIKKKGWVRRVGAIGLPIPFYEHADYHSSTLSWYMIEDNQGKTLTVKEHKFQNWYAVEENKFYWPANVFLEENSVHTCEEGMTPIDGWFICKTCGTNLKEIK